MKYLLPYWLKYRVLFIVGITFVLFEAVCDLLQPRIMAELVNRGASTGTLAAVGRYAIIMLIIALAGMGAALTRNYLASTISQRFSADLRLDLFKKIQSLSADGIDKFEGGSLVTRMTNDVTQMQNFANGAMRMFVKAPFMCIGAIAMSATLNLRTMFIVVPIVLLVAMTILLAMRTAYPKFARMQDALDKLNTTLREYLAGIRLVKAFRRFGSETRRFGGANDTLTTETIAANRVLALSSPFMALFVNLGIAAMLLLGSRWIGCKTMEIGAIMAFVTYLAQMMQSLNMISNMLNMFVRVRASNGRIAEVFAEEPDSAETAVSDGSTIDWGNMVLRFEGVSFRYRGSTGQEALSGISIELRQGETLGVIGSTGSGKSTLAALMMRFYEPTEGTVTLCGTAVSVIPEGDYREHVAIVPQSPSLFSGTIRENLLWGKENATDGELREAAMAAQALPFIESSENGFDRVIEQSGVNVSGGQKQRISIARALVREPSILILDDCTSALDLVTEARVRAALLEKKLTTVFISQRISTVSRCSKILVLDSGIQAGYGTHDELMSSCDVYRDIYASQIGAA